MAGPLTARRRRRCCSLAVSANRLRPESHRQLSNTTSLTDPTADLSASLMGDAVGGDGDGNAPAPTGRRL
jgi:hypothetical protein